MMNFGALNGFDSLLKSKALECINHVIYTGVLVNNESMPWLV